MQKVVKQNITKLKAGNSFPISLVQTTVSLRFDTTVTEITPVNLNCVIDQNVCGVYHLLQELLGVIFEALSSSLTWNYFSVFTQYLLQAVI